MTINSIKLRASSLSQLSTQLKAATTLCEAFIKRRQYHSSSRDDDL